MGVFDRIRTRGPLGAGLDASNAQAIHSRPSEELIGAEESLHLEFKSSTWHPYGHIPNGGEKEHDEEARIGDCQSSL